MFETIQSKNGTKQKGSLARRCEWVRAGVVLPASRRTAAPPPLRAHLAILSPYRQRASTFKPGVYPPRNHFNLAVRESRIVLLSFSESAACSVLTPLGSTEEETQTSLPSDELSVFSKYFHFVYSDEFSTQPWTEANSILLDSTKSHQFFLSVCFFISKDFFHQKQNKHVKCR